MSHERPHLRNARNTLKLTCEAVGQMIAPPGSYMVVYRLERGSTASASLREICRAYMREARRLGYDPWEYHESVLCPGDGFPAPVKQDDAELDRILGSAISCQPPAVSGENNQANHHNSLNNTGDSGGSAAPSPVDESAISCQPSAVSTEGGQ